MISIKEIENSNFKEVYNKNLADKNSEFFWYHFKESVENLIENLERTTDDEKLKEKLISYQLELKSACNLLNKLQKEEKPRLIYVTGHSLGAGIASIFCFHHSEVTALYTYGCPRNASWSKSKELKVPHYRCVNNNDVVTKVPPSIMGFSHHGELQYINYYGNIRELTTWQRIKDSWRGRKRAWQKGQKFDGIYDHMMDEYCACLEDKD
jgi:hypothetical protein